jgi:predicted outer membrane repeat protein
MGGAVSVTKSQLTHELLLKVQNCTFIERKATQAGAIFIQNVSFFIDNTYFCRNSAEKGGGGIHAAIRPDRPALFSTPYSFKTQHMRVED